uniref:Uncharacterized protein n=1 Tax=Anopheles maculatus TaxID=74869 RepID=A0A182SW57_9DIPT
MFNVWPPGPTGTGRARNRGGTAPPINQWLVGRPSTVNRPLSTGPSVRLLLVVTLAVTTVLLSNGVHGTSVPAAGEIGEDDYSGAIQDLETGCINRCPDQREPFDRA